jgi:hypothetical protein
VVNESGAEVLGYGGHLLDITPTQLVERRVIEPSPRRIYSKGDGRRRCLAIADLEDDLAPLAADCDPFERRLRVREREDRVDRRAKLTHVRADG